MIVSWQTEMGMNWLKCGECSQDGDGDWFGRAPDGDLVLLTRVDARTEHVEYADGLGWKVVGGQWLHD